jgi:DNA invertase Pin-like site-specific DNA recombinase
MSSESIWMLPSPAGAKGAHLSALMASAQNRDLDCVLVWKFDRFTRHLLTALEEFDHLGVRFISV